MESPMPWSSLLVLLVTTTAFAQDAAEASTAASSGWQPMVVIGLLALIASWAGVMIALLRFAMSVGQLTTTVDHLKTGVEVLSTKFDALQGHEQRMIHLEKEVEKLRDAHGRIIHLEAVTVGLAPVGRRATGTTEG